jgi:hypothetical protein
VAPMDAVFTSPCRESSPSRPGRSLVIVLTELSRLQHKISAAINNSGEVDCDVTVYIRISSSYVWYGCETRSVFAKENIWTQETGSNRRLDRTA